MRTLASLLLLLLALGLAGPPARAQETTDRIDPLPKDLEGIGVDEHLNARLPLDAQFKDERGRDVVLGDYFSSGKPVILTLNYLACPMLCTVTLNGMVDALREVNLKLGEDYEIVTVSFHPLEGPSLAKLKQQNYRDYWGEDAVGYGWHFLTGGQTDIDRVTEAVGFRYKWLPETREYSHAAVINVATPQGQLSRYLYGIEFDPTTLKLSLIEASEGKIGSPMDQLLLFCYHYDSSKGTYTPMALNIMRLGGTLTIVIFGLFLLGFWLREKHRRLSEEDAPPPVDFSKPAHRGN